MIILLASYQGQASPQYTDITDILVSGQQTVANIDFNGDGTLEFSLGDQGGFFGIPSRVVAETNDPNLLNFVTKTATWDQFESIPLGTLIDSTSGYYATVDCFFNNAVFPTGDGYIGVKFDLNGNMHYGWVFVELHTNQTVTVKSYAYETTPNTGIAAGDTGGTSAVLVTGITVQGQNGLSSILENNNLQMEETVLPANASNNSVIWSVTNQTGTATINSTTGVLSALTAGTVLVEAMANDGSGITGSTVINIQQATSITSIQSEQFKLYPNPAQGYFYLETEEATQYQLFNLQGQEVQTGILTKEKQKIDCSLPKGLYLIHVSSAKKQASQLISIN